LEPKRISRNKKEIEEKLAKAESLKNLETRKDELQLESRVGKASMVNRETAKEQQGGFFCKACDCLMKDSQAYLDHINGKKHNKLMGMSMRVERVGVDRVREKLQKLKKVADKPIENFEDFEKKFEDEMRKKAEEKHKMEHGRKKLKVENEKIEAQLTANDVADFDLPMSFNSKRKK